MPQRPLRMKEIPDEEKSLAEIFRICAKEWVELDGAARLLEETKTVVLSEKMRALGDMPVTRAELLVRASPEWREFITAMVEARSAANLARVKMRWVEMRFTQWQSDDANQRAEFRMSRG